MIVRKLMGLAAISLCACYESTPFTLFDDPYPAGPWPASRAGPYEGFGSGEFDLEGYAVVFSPRRGGAVTYDWTVIEIGESFAITPGSGPSSVEVSLWDDDAVEYELRRMGTIRFYGVAYDRLSIGSNGYVTFGAADASLSPSPESHYQYPAVSLLRGDLNPNDGGRIVVDEWPGRLVVTYVGVPRFGDPGTRIDVQAILHANGVIELHYLAVTSRHSWLVGLSNGLAGADPREVDFL